MADHRRLLSEKGSVLSASLLRTRQSAEEACRGAGISQPITIDERLLELDYGLWSGRSDVEIVSGFGEAALDRWRNEGVYPEGVAFSPDRDEVIRSVAAVVEGVQTGDASVVWLFSSQGILRFFPEVLLHPGTDRAFAPISGRMRTGAYGIISLAEQGSAVVEWDVRPGGCADDCGSGRSKRDQ
jgi:broad specificity phosphatase PhoE